MDTPTAGIAAAIGHRATIRAARFNAASDISDETPAYAELDDRELADCMAEMENVIEGMALMGIGTAHESRLLARMKEEQDRRAA